MPAVIQYILLFLFLIVSQISGQNGFKPSITCYTKYDYEETKSQTSNNILSYSYQEAEITQYGTPDNEMCSNVGCACFSYKSICSYSSPGTNHFSSCTEEDRQNRVIKWHRGWASHDKCEQMRRHPQTYQDLTCCYTDRCNDQPGKITKIVDPQLPVQRNPYYPYQTPQPLYATHKSSPQYNNHVRYPTTTRSSDIYRPISDSDGSLPRGNSLSFNSSSKWITFFALVFCLLIIL
jgi:hypothetical protein